MATIHRSTSRNQQRADELMAQLQSRGIAAEDMQAFYVNPPGNMGRTLLAGHGRRHRYRRVQLGPGLGVAAGAAAGLAAGRDRRGCHTAAGADYRSGDGGRGSARWRHGGVHSRRRGPRTKKSTRRKHGPPILMRGHASRVA
jgi:hypothetical protein